MTLARLLSLVLICLVVAPGGSLFAQDPAVTSAAAVLEHYEGLAADLKPGDHKGAQAMIDALKPIGLKLQAVKDKSEPNFVAVANRYNALRQKIVDRANEKAEGESDLMKLHNDVLAAFKDMKTLKVEDLENAEARGAWESRMADFKKRLATLDPQDPNTRIVSANLSKLDGYLKDALGKVDAAKKKEGEDGAKKDGESRPMTSDEVRAEYERKRREREEARQKEIARRKAEQEADRVDGENIQAKIDAIKAKYLAEGRVPQRLQDPLEPEFVRGWAARVKSILDEVPADVAKLEALRAEPNVDKQKIQSAIYWVGSNLPRQLEEMKAESTILLDGRVENGLHSARFIQSTDASDENQLVNRVLGEGSFDQQMKQLNDGLSNLAIAEAFDAGFERKGGPDRAKQRAELEAGIKRLQELAVLGLENVRMPKANSTDPKLEAAAKEVFARKKYGVGKVLRSVISYGPHHREKKEGYVRPGSSYTTVSVYNYVWDEFGVITAEREGDEIWLYWNKLKFYTSGDTTTTLDAWILSERFKTTRILEKNLP